MESTTCISHKEFWERKVDWFIKMWQYGQLRKFQRRKKKESMYA
jgi:hypothetical protein